MKIFHLFYFSCMIVVVLAHLHGDADHHHKQHHNLPKFDERDIVVALMLFGSIAFHISLFYLVNHSDSDMRRYSWETISSIISILCSLLIFQACKDVIHINTQAIFDPLLRAAIDFAQLFVWLWCMQAVIYFKAGAYKMGDHVSHKCLQDAKASALLFAHITGFAAIHAFGAVQQLPYFAETPLRSFYVAVIAYVGMLVTTSLTDYVREWKALQNDGRKDRHEELWDDEVEEAEDECIGLAISFLAMQAIRFAISAELPDQEGHSHTEPTDSQVLLLLCTAVAMLPGVTLFGYLRSIQSPSEKGSRKGRLFSSLHMVCSMCFAWSLLFAIKGKTAQLQVLGLWEGVIGKVGIALMVSGVAFLVIFLLDKVADRLAGHEGLDGPIITVILSFGVMVGFAWEGCFEAAIETISGGVLRSDPEWEWTQFGLALALVSLVLPAWKKYILAHTLDNHAHPSAVADTCDASKHPKAH